MKKILLWIALIAVGYYIYSDFLSPPDKNTTRSGQDLRIKMLFEKVSSTPVSAQEARPVFKGAMIDICERMARINENVYGTAVECTHNFERLASEQCFEQLTDFDGKIYNSLSVLITDIETYQACASDIIYLEKL
ncbi:hypothetical protein [Psychromonas sp. MME2]|uniref:hypothetical protein n=1 Tax=unclassified Psychromonas TaxID=2614957 RepID=UPI00339C5230